MTGPTTCRYRPPLSPRRECDPDQRQWAARLSEVFPHRLDLAAQIRQVQAAVTGQGR
jgi:hypothetical protein